MITVDNDKAFNLHEYIAQSLGIAWYFADPDCAWQRVTNENE